MSLADPRLLTFISAAVEEELKSPHHLIAAPSVRNIRPHQAALIRNEASLIQLSFWSGGKLISTAWQEGVNLFDCLRLGIIDAKQREGHSAIKASDIIQVSAPVSWTPYTPDMDAPSAVNDLRGVYGFQVSRGSTVRRISPLQMISRNLSPSRAIDLLCEALEPDGDSDLDRSIVAFETVDFTIQVGKMKTIRAMRGSEAVSQNAITLETTSDMAQKMSRWMVRQVSSDGRTTYKYWPSNGKYSDSNNTIRQFMASTCLAIASQRYTDSEMERAVARNFRYNFKRFLVQKRGLSYIEDFGKVKLGAAAVASMAILSLRNPSQYQTILRGLISFIQSMQNKDGSFRTFFIPPGRNDNQNFYPGEALLALAMLQQRQPSIETLQRIQKGFTYYRDWFMADPNPAFVPWHTQAYYILYQMTADRDVAAFVLEMNDWLVTLQEDKGRPADVVGEFFDPRQPHLGRPHSSSTGVYLEGLIDALRVARSVGDFKRAESYRHAIMRGLRSLRQLQFKNDIDMFYISKKERVEGAVRTSTYDNTVRIDNVQHGLMATFKILDTLRQPEDYVIES